MKKTRWLLGVTCLLFAASSAFADLSDNIKSFNSDYDKLIQEASSPDYFKRFNDPRYQDQINQQIQDVLGDLNRIDLEIDRKLKAGDTDIPASPTNLPYFSTNNSIKKFADHLEMVKRNRDKIEEALAVAKQDHQRIKKVVKVNGWVILFKAFGTNVFTPMAFNNIAGAVTELANTVAQNYIVAGGDKSVEGKMVKHLKEMQNDPSMKELDEALQEAKKAAEQPGGMKDSDIFVYQAKLSKGYKKVIDNYTTLINDLNEYIRKAEEELRRRAQLQHSYEETIKRAFGNSKWLNHKFDNEIKIVSGQKGIKPVAVGPAIKIPSPSSNAAPNDQQRKAAEAVLKADEAIFQDIATLLGKPYKSLVQIINERSKKWKTPSLDDYFLKIEVGYYGFDRYQALACLRDLIDYLTNNILWQQRIVEVLDGEIQLAGNPDKIKFNAEARKNLESDKVYLLSLIQQVDTDLSASLASNRQIMAAVRQKLSSVKMTGFEQYDSVIRDQRLKGIKTTVEKREAEAAADEYKWKKLLAAKGVVLADVDESLKEVGEAEAFDAKFKREFTYFKKLYEDFFASYKAVEVQANKQQVLSMLDKGKEMEAAASDLCAAVNELAKAEKINSSLTDQALKKQLVAVYQQFDIPVIGYVHDKIINSGYFASPERKNIEKFYNSVYVAQSFVDGNRARSITPIDEVNFPGYQNGEGGTASRLAINDFDQRIKKMKDELAFCKKNVAALRQLMAETNQSLGFIKASYKEKALGAYYDNVNTLCYDFSGRMKDEFYSYADLVEEFGDRLDKLEKKIASQRLQVKVSEDLQEEQLQMRQAEERRQTEIGLQRNRLMFTLSKSKEIVRDINTINNYFKMAISQNNIATAKSYYLAALDRRDSTIANKSEADQAYAYLAGQNAASVAETGYYSQIGENDQLVSSMVREIEKVLKAWVPDVSNIKESSGNVGEGFAVEDVIAGRGPVPSAGVITHGTQTLAVGENFSFALGGVTTDPTKADFFYGGTDQLILEYADQCAIVDVGTTDFSVAPQLSAGSSPLANAVVGHYYAVLALGNKYGKVKITAKITGVSAGIEWWYQPDGSRQF